jgi:hypothetical protein
MSNLTQLSTLKARLKLEDTVDDAFLTRLIAAGSSLFAAYCNREFARAVGVTQEFAGDEQELNLERPPIESVSAFEIMASETDGWEAQTGVDYQLSPKRTHITLANRLASSGYKLRVTYTGGFVLPGGTPTGIQRALPAEIENACVEQIVYWFQRKDELGLVSVSAEGGSIQQFTTANLLPMVKLALQPFVRWIP